MLTPPLRIFSNVPCTQVTPRRAANWQLPPPQRPSLQAIHTQESCQLAIHPPLRVSLQAIHTQESCQFAAPPPFRVSLQVFPSGRGGLRCPGDSSIGSSPSPQALSSCKIVVIVRPIDRLPLPSGIRPLRPASPQACLPSGMPPLRPLSPQVSPQGLSRQSQPGCL